MKYLALIVAALVIAFAFWSKDVWRRPEIWLDARALWGEDGLDG